MSCKWCDNITEDTDYIYWQDTEYSDVPKKENIAFYLNCGDHFEASV